MCDGAALGSFMYNKKKQDGGRIKIYETFSSNSLKEDLSIDTTFDPCYFSWDSPFKVGTVGTYLPYYFHPNLTLWDYAFKNLRWAAFSSAWTGDTVWQ